MKSFVVIIVVLISAMVMAEETQGLRLCIVIEESGSYVPACTRPAHMGELITTCREGAYSYLRKEIHSPIYVVDERGTIKWFCR